MEASPLVRIEDHSGERVVSFAVNCSNPEEAAWNLLRDWAVPNLSGYTTRRYIGCAPRGHHPEHEEHRPDEEPGSHEYMAQVLLSEGEGSDDMFLGAPVLDGPDGLFLVGDVALNEFNGDGTIDIGSSMQKSFAVMSEYLRDVGGYEFQLGVRPYFEEHLFTDEWFVGDGELAGFRLWLPIRKL